MLCYSNPLLWEAIGKNRKSLLVTNVFILVLFYIVYFHFRGIVRFPWDEDTVEIIFDVIAIFVSWFSVITIIAYGQHYLNKPHPWLKYFSEGLYPFYILHQTAIIAIGYYICQLDWSIANKFWSVRMLTLVSCVVFYLVVIRTNNLMRFFFGLKKSDGVGSEYYNFK